MNRSYNGRGSVDQDDESGVYYLVRKPGTNGEKHLVKRPRAPLTSVPMDDDFDAYTYTGTQTVVSRRYPADERTLAQGAAANLSRSLSHGAAAGASRDRSGSTPNTGSKPFVYRGGYDGTGLLSQAQVPTSLPPPPRRKRASEIGPASNLLLSPQSGLARTHNRSSSDALPDTKGKARQRVEPQEAYGGHQEYVEEMEHMFSQHGDFDISLSRVNESSGTRENVQLGRVQSTKSTRNNPRSPINGTFGVGDAGSGLARNASSKSHQRGQKPPPPAFEEVSRTVVENSKDKTVTISTWREHVAREVDDGIQRTSVYYQGDIQSYASSEMDDIARGSRSRGGAQHGYLDPPMQFAGNEAKSEGPMSPVAKSGAVPHDLSQNSIQIPDEHNIRTAETHDAQQLSPEKPPKTSLLSSSSEPTSGSSDSELPPTPPPKPPKLTIRTTEAIQSSTPVDPHMQTLPSFHPTKDGSPISTIRSTTSASSHTFDKILNSCKPSLVHLVGPLEKLGITTVEHLQALGDLNPNIRDRELKDDALRLGVTVMEWAILVDRLRSI